MFMCTADAPDSPAPDRANRLHHQRRLGDPEPGAAVRRRHGDAEVARLRDGSMKVVRKAALDILPAPVVEAKSRRTAPSRCRRLPAERGLSAKSMILSDRRSFARPRPEEGRPGRALVVAAQMPGQPADSHLASPSWDATLSGRELDGAVEAPRGGVEGAEDGLASRTGRSTRLNADARKAITVTTFTSGYPPTSRSLLSRSASAAWPPRCARFTSVSGTRHPR